MFPAKWMPNIAYLWTLGGENRIPNGTCYCTTSVHRFFFQKEVHQVKQTNVSVVSWILYRNGEYFNCADKYSPKCHRIAGPEVAIHIGRCKACLFARAWRKLGCDSKLGRHAVTWRTATPWHGMLVPFLKEVLKILLSGNISAVSKYIYGDCQKIMSWEVQELETNGSCFCFGRHGYFSIIQSLESWMNVPSKSHLLHIIKTHFLISVVLMCNLDLIVQCLYSCISN